MVALAVLGTGPILTNSYEAVDRVDRDIVEAARGMGMTRLQILRQSSCLSRCRCCSRASALPPSRSSRPRRSPSVAGGGGLGDIIVNQASYRLSGVLGASMCVMALSAAVYLGLAGLQLAVTPRGLRRTSLGGVLSRKEQL